MGVGLTKNTGQLDNTSMFSKCFFQTSAFTESSDPRGGVSAGAASAFGWPLALAFAVALAALASAAAAPCTRGGIAL